MEFDILGLIVAAVALVLGAYAVIRRGGVGEVTTTLEGVVSHLSDFQAAVGEARDLVLAAQQLYESGRLKRDQRFEWVYSRLKKALPNLDEDTLTGSVEAAVAWMKLLRNKEPSLLEKYGTEGVVNFPDSPVLAISRPTE